MPDMTLTQATGRLALTLSITRMGRDLSVCLHGGDTPHIGAVAVSRPRPSLRDPQRVSATTSVIALTGHKEDGLARELAHEMASSLGVVVTLACGIHLDHITPGELAETPRLAAILVNQALERLTDEPVPSGRTTSCTHHQE